MTWGTLRYCRYCQHPFQPSLYRPQQRVCSQPDCQARRRRDYHLRKLETDPEYRQIVRDSRKKWREAHPEWINRLIDAKVPRWCQMPTISNARTGPELHGKTSDVIEILEDTARRAGIPRPVLSPRARASELGQVREQLLIERYRAEAKLETLRVDTVLDASEVSMSKVLRDSINFYQQSTLESRPLFLTR